MRRRCESPECGCDEARLPQPLQRPRALSPTGPSLRAPAPGEVMHVGPPPVQLVEASQHGLEDTGGGTIVAERQQGVRLSDGRRRAQPDLEGVRAPPRER